MGANDLFQLCSVLPALLAPVLCSAWFCRRCRCTVSVAVFPVCSRRAVALPAGGPGSDEALRPHPGSAVQVLAEAGSERFGSAEP